jgi:hypothetical protein
MAKAPHLLTNPYAVLMSGSATLGICPMCQTGSLNQERRHLSLMAPGSEYATLQVVPELDEDLWVAIPHRFSAHFRCDNEACFEGSMVQGTTIATKGEGCGCPSCLERGYHMDFALWPTSVTLAPDLIAVPLGLGPTTTKVLRSAFLLAYGEPLAALGRFRTSLDSWIDGLMAQHGVVLAEDEWDSLANKLKALRSQNFITKYQYSLAHSIKNLGNDGAHKTSATQSQVLKMLKQLSLLFDSLDEA